MKQKQWKIALAGIVLLALVFTVSVIVSKPKKQKENFVYERGQEDVVGDDEVENHDENSIADSTPKDVTDETDGTNITESWDNIDSKRETDTTEIIVEGGSDKKEDTSELQQEDGETEEDETESGSSKEESTRDSEPIELPFVPYK